MQYAAIYSETIWHEGDERSRTNPGHGYPGHSETVEKIKIFKDEADCKSWILTQQNVFGKKVFKIIRFDYVNVKQEVKLELE